jgi:hypothetical protein
MKSLVLVVGVGLAWFGHRGGSDLMFWAGVGLMFLWAVLVVNWTEGPPWFDFFGGGGDGGGD